MKRAHDALEEPWITNKLKLHKVPVLICSKALLISLHGLLKKVVQEKRAMKRNIEAFFSKTTQDSRLSLQR